LVPFSTYTMCLPQVEGQNEGVRTAQGPLGPWKDTFDSRASIAPCPAVVERSALQLEKDACDLIATGLVHIRGIDPCTLGVVN
jgi:hypothetical protein